MGALGRNKKIQQRLEGGERYQGLLPTGIIRG